MTENLSEHLKSNMDRFIDKIKPFFFSCHLYLKSNMDRFIAFCQLLTFSDIFEFKIQ